MKANKRNNLFIFTIDVWDFRNRLFLIYRIIVRKMAISIKRFFATLRFAQNDNYLDNKGKGAGSGSATSSPLTLPNTLTRCHSELSEESLVFPRTLVI
jgi:hypothetical protein